MGEKERLESDRDTAREREREGGGGCEWREGGTVCMFLCTIPFDYLTV